MDYENVLKSLREKRARQQKLLAVTDEHINAIMAIKAKTEPELPLPSSNEKPPKR